MSDVARLVGAVTRHVESREVDGRLARVVVATRDYDTDVEDLWDALTNAERIPRWFLPIEGELKVGGRYQFKGNAGGEILACEAPRRLKVTWMMGEGPSWVTLTLTPHGAAARLELEHVAHVDPAFWDRYGPGAVGVGWDQAMYGLSLHLATGETLAAAEFQAWALSDEGKAFTRGCSEDWRRASVAGGADPAAAQASADNTTAFYLGEPH